MFAALANFNARVIIFALVTICASPASAERYFAPVQIVKATSWCSSLDMLKQRQRLLAEQRTERLNDLKGLDPFIPTQSALRCGNVEAGKFMFFDKWNGNYACVRPRVGADCFWLQRDAIGEVFELFPGRTLEQGNKGVTCAQWERAAAQAYAYNNTPSKDLAGGQGLNTNQRLCLSSFHALQAYAREATAYDFCPQLDTQGRKPKVLQLIETNRRFIKEDCYPPGLQPR